MNPLFNICLLLLLVSCSTPKYFICTTDTPVTLYEIKDVDAVMMTIPPGEQIIATGPSDTYRIVNYKDYSGYIVSRKFAVEKKYGTKTFKPPATVKEYAYRQEIKKLKESVSVKKSTTTLTPVLSDSLSQRQTSVPAATGTGRPKTVQVKGYYRKNGTYVQPHTRSAPRRH